MSKRKPHPEDGYEELMPLFPTGAVEDDPRVAAFNDFDAANPHVYTLFVKYAHQAAARRPRFSARTILHRIRWHTAIETDDPEGFKVNNNWSPFYARRFEREYPRHAGFFSMRGSVADEMGDER